MSKYLKIIAIIRTAYLTQNVPQIVWQPGNPNALGQRTVLTCTP